MALDFPNSPSDGQVYNGFVWDDTAGLWSVRGSITNPAGIGSAVNAIVDTTGGVTTYIFKSDGTLTVDVAGHADILVVAGGGAGHGGIYAGGGGGAGGVIFQENAYLPAGSHSVLVGAGGVAYSLQTGTAAQNTWEVQELQMGDASSLLTYIAAGGGSGAGAYAGFRGGSSGGGGYACTVDMRVSGIPGQGNSGGTGAGNGGSPYPGGGGGGAGQQGSDATSVNSPGNGGNGRVVNIISTSLATSESVGEVSGGDVYFGGGGAGGNRSGVSGTGGLGGGGVARADGLANTGGGGGGNSSNGGNLPGDGGSGVVIVRIGA